MLTFCYVGPAAFGKILLAWFSKPPIPIHIQLIFDTQHLHDFLILDIRERDARTVLALPPQCRRCGGIATQDKSNLVHEAALKSTSSQCALITDGYCPPIMVWMSCIMQQCHNKIVNLNDFAVSRKVFGKVHDATRDTLVILMASVAAPDAPTPFDPK